MTIKFQPINVDGTTMVVLMKEEADEVIPATHDEAMAMMLWLQEKRTMPTCQTCNKWFDCTIRSGLTYCSDHQKG